MASFQSTAEVHQSPSLHPALKEKPNDFLISASVQWVPGFGGGLSAREGRSGIGSPWLGRSLRFQDFRWMFFFLQIVGSYWGLMHLKREHHVSHLASVRVLSKVLCAFQGAQASVEI